MRLREVAAAVQSRAMRTLPTPTLVALVLSCTIAGCGDDDGGAADGNAGVVDAPAMPPDAAPAAPDAARPDAGTPDTGPATGPLPDLTVNRARAEADLAIQVRNFSDGACELTEEEDCVLAPGDRTLLRFSTMTPNIGTADMFLGTPTPGNPQFVWSPCHEHYHFLGYAEYHLVDAGGTDVATGHKQAFCLLDSDEYVTDDPSVSDNALYNCAYQGIQRGWADVYTATLPCQWIDVTDVPPGDYTLVIRINNGGTLPELRYDNNMVSIPLTLGDSSLSSPTEACAGDIDTASSDGLHRECGWEFKGTYDCTPGGQFRTGCAAECTGLGACTGDPMIRVCDHASPDGNCSNPSSLEEGDDACGSKCPRVRNVECPPSGQVDVYAAPFTVGDPYTCDVAFEMQ